MYSPENSYIMGTRERACDPANCCIVGGRERAFIFSSLPPYVFNYKFTYFSLNCHFGITGYFWP